MLQSLLVLLFIGTTTIQLCSCAQHPELVLLTASKQSGGGFCLRETVQLKCIFPEGKLALQWYVNDSERPYYVDYLAEDLPGHSTSTPFDNYTLVSIIKQEFYRGNYICAVDIPHPGRDVQSNSVEVVFEGIQSFDY